MGRSSTARATDPGEPRVEVGVDEMLVQDQPLEGSRAALADEAVPTVLGLLNHRALRDYWLGSNPGDDLAGDERTRVLYAAVLSVDLGDFKLASRVASRSGILPRVPNRGATTTSSWPRGWIGSSRPEAQDRDGRPSPGVHLRSRPRRPIVPGILR